MNGGRGGADALYSLQIVHNPEKLNFYFPCLMVVLMFENLGLGTIDLYGS